MSNDERVGVLLNVVSNSLLPTGLFITLSKKVTHNTTMLFLTKGNLVGYEIR